MCVSVCKCVCVYLCNCIRWVPVKPQIRPFKNPNYLGYLQTPNLLSRSWCSVGHGGGNFHTSVNLSVPPGLPSFNILMLEISSYSLWNNHHRPEISFNLVISLTPKAPIQTKASNHGWRERCFKALLRPQICFRAEQTWLRYKKADKGNMRLAIPIALLCLPVYLSGGKQGSRGSFVCPLHL